MWKWFTILSCLALASCSRCDGAKPPRGGDTGGLSLATVDSCSLPAMPGEGSFRVAADVAYQEVGGQRLAMDVAWPSSPGRKPLVVMIHGGGWSVGHRAQLEIGRASCRERV